MQDFEDLQERVLLAICPLILLADPDALDDDLLESCLYVYREKLRAS